MKRAIICAAFAAATMISVPAAAQNYGGGWNSNQFWSGAPSGAWERIGYLRDRIQRGRADGSLTRSEAARAERQLRQIQREAWRMRRSGGGIGPAENDRLQARLDDLSRNLRWMRHNGTGYGDRGAYGNRDYSRYQTNYDARRYYRDDPRYQERVLTANDEVYRGSDGRYYCKRSDGTTGLIIGGAGGALLGNVIDGGRNRVGGTLIGGALGALLGRSIDRSNSEVRCR
jgi:hypothetical protein